MEDHIQTTLQHIGSISVDGIQNDRRNQNKSTEQKDACMLCRQSRGISSFKTDDGQATLETGDHIEIYLKSKYPGYCIKHHAIVEKVEDISEDGRIANVFVVDVVGKERDTADSKFSCKILNFLWYILCFKWCKKTMLFLHSGRLHNVSTSCKAIKKIEYRKPKYEKKTIIERAKTLLKSKANHGQNKDRNIQESVTNDTQIYSTTGQEDTNDKKEEFQSEQTSKTSYSQPVAVAKNHILGQSEGVNTSRKVRSKVNSTKGKSVNTLPTESIETARLLSNEELPAGFGSTIDEPQCDSYTNTIGPIEDTNAFKETSIDNTFETTEDSSDESTRKQEAANKNDESTDTKSAEERVEIAEERPTYNLFARNCEHFVAACVGGPEILTLDNITKSTCLQTVRCFWISFHIVLTLAQGVNYTVNFYIYAFIAENNEKYNHFTRADADFLRSVCKCRDTRGFEIICDWYLFEIFIVILAIIFFILRELQIRWNRSHYVCQQCIRSGQIVYWIVCILIIACEIFNIFMEKYLYEMIDYFNFHYVFTVFCVFVISTLEALFVAVVGPYVLAKHVIVRLLGKYKRCTFDEQSYKYVMHYF